MAAGHSATIEVSILYAHANLGSQEIFKNKPPFTIREHRSKIPWCSVKADPVKFHHIDLEPIRLFLRMIDVNSSSLDE